jgi:hypothetical protein
VVLTFECEHFRAGWPVNLSLIEDIVASFRYLDEPAASPPEGPQEYSLNGLRFALELTDDWEVVHDALAGAVRAQRVGVGSASVFVGNRSGTIVTCRNPAGSRETCRRITVSSLAELTDAMESDEMHHGGVSNLGVEHTHGHLSFDGQSANRISIKAPDGLAESAENVTYILAFREGRPIILRFTARLDDPPTGWVRSFLDGFTFLD